MTVSYPLDAFDHGQAVRRSRRPAMDGGKLTAIAITVAIHVLILVAALTAVHVARPKAMQELSVQIMPQKIETARDVAPPPRLVAPSAVSAPPPEIVIQTVTPPTVASQSVAKPVPPAPVAAPLPTAGEARDKLLALLLAWLNRFKQYPRSARQAHIEGVVMLHFVLDAQGKVLSCDIAQSSGRPVLDAEALALIRRAQPLPALPADYPTPTLDAIVPIAFSLNS